MGKPKNMPPEMEQYCAQLEAQNHDARERLNSWRMIALQRGNEQIQAEGRIMQLEEDLRNQKAINVKITNLHNNHIQDMQAKFLRMEREIKELKHQLNRNFF